MVPAPALNTAAYASEARPSGPDFAVLRATVNCWLAGSGSLRLSSRSTAPRADPEPLRSEMKPISSVASGRRWALSACATRSRNAARTLPAAVYSSMAAVVSPARAKPSA